MNFKGTEGISREDLKVWIERAGGAWNGYTWIDQTTYFETLSSDALDLALRIESERMTSCIYEEDEFESERSVIIAELQGTRTIPPIFLESMSQRRLSEYTLMDGRRLAGYRILRR